MQDEPECNHEGKEDVEQNRNQKVCNSRPQCTVHFRGPVDEYGAHRYIVNVSPEFRRLFEENLNAHL